MIPIETINLEVMLTQTEVCATRLGHAAIHTQSTHTTIRKNIEAQMRNYTCV